jgi:hypothetical protein
MARKNLNFILTAFILTLLSGVIFFYLSGKSEFSSQENIKHRFLNKKKDLTIRGFRFSGYHQGQKAIAIKAAKFSIEKKKIGVFKFAPMRAARFRGAEVDLYVNNEGFAEDLQDKKDIIVKGLFSQETMPVSAMETNVIRWMGKISGAFVLILSLLFSIYLPNAYAQTCEEYIGSGEQLLYTESIDNILIAHATFEEAAVLCPMEDPL